ncbi:hypothetical protein [Oceanivirga miroungae]|uniref:Uncharacterized protein n=1 Tax=Oceanivirga miroungae TaxID=1130046 RepID=A0A6I8MBW1_9FUSO|nr:hypothetical protein [Oceanivirga miroungae]VWL84977.1 hypothetical protein OMES3154_00249 [Oceanivirga miroungae]
MRKKLFHKTLSLISLMFFCINSILVFSNTNTETNLQNFKVWKTSSEEYSCTKWDTREVCETRTREVEDGTEEYNCHSVDDYEDKETCHDVNIPKDCRTVDDYEDRESCTTTRVRTGSHEECTGGGTREECSDETHQVCRVWGSSSGMASTGPGRDVCQKWDDETVSVCHDVDIPRECHSVDDYEDKESCTTTRVRTGSHEECTGGGTREECSTTRVRTGSHEECTGGGTRRECSTTRVRTGSHEECDTRTRYRTEEYEDCDDESYSYTGTCTRDNSHWENINPGDTSLVDVINKLNSYAIVYKNDTLTVNDIIKLNNENNIRITKQPSTSRTGESKYEITARVNGSTRKIQGTAMVVDKPNLTYKQIRTAVINSTVVPNQVYETIVPSNEILNDNRYTVSIIGNVDTATIGVKPVNLKVTDTLKNKEFTGYTSDVRVQEEMKPITWKDNIEKYIDSKFEIINKKLEKEMEIEI